MIIDYLFSSPDGDILLGPEDLEMSFLIAPAQPHPFLKLGDYFKAIEKFLLKDNGKGLRDALRANAMREGRLDRIRIRSEKHGALYHVASAEALGGDSSIKLSVSSAVSAQGKACISNEYDILKALHRSLRLPYLPKVYDKGDVTCQDGRGHEEIVTLILGEWFEGFHEWHLSVDRADGRQKVSIWDLENGHRYASDQEGFEIFRQASSILTLYYDPHTFKQIHPWRHAAGDFVVKTGADGLHVKLTTARGYRSIMDFFSEGPVHPVIALVYFFLNLTVRMRLDRLNGVEETVWAGDFAVQAVTQGVFDALQIMVERGTLTSAGIQEAFSLLQSLMQEEVERLYEPLLAFYEEDSPDEELAVIHAHLKAHVGSLCRTLQGFR